jgi:hypothetical protein
MLAFSIFIISSDHLQKVQTVLFEITLVVVNDGFIEIICFVGSFGDALAGNDLKVHPFNSAPEFKHNLTESIGKKTVSPANEKGKSIHVTTEPGIPKNPGWKMS